MATDDVRYKADILRRWSMLTSERSSWVSHWHEISTFLLPRAGRFFSSDRNRGVRRHNSIYDSTGTRALRILAAGMMAGMTSPARPWFKMGTADPDLGKSAAVKEWLAVVTRTMLRVFQESNTYPSLHKYYGELGAFGTSAGLISPDFHDVLTHHALTVGEYCIATNWKGEVVTLYREFEKTVAEIVTEFGQKDSSGALLPMAQQTNLSISVRNMFERGILDAWIRLVHAVEPRTDRDPTQRDAKNMPWKSCYYELASDAATPLRESGYTDFPGLVARWDTGGGDIYGNGPGMEALGDIKGLQHKQLRKAEVTDYQTRPPLQMPASLKNKEADTLPGSITYYDGTSSGPVIKSLFEVELNQKYLLEDIQDSRQLINQAFSVDVFLMLANATETRMTATEVAERHEEKMMILGPTVERLQKEMLGPICDRCFREVLRLGIVPPPPQELHGKPLNVDYISILAQAQRAIATNGVDRYVSNLGAIAAFKPGVLDKFDEDEWADRYADMLGVDPELIVPNDQVALIRAQRAKVAQAAQASAAANQNADTAQKLANSPTSSDNALTALAGGVGRNLIRPTAPGAATAPFSGYN